jgi:hypothetical protein
MSERTMTSEEIAKLKVLASSVNPADAYTADDDRSYDVAEVLRNFAPVLGELERVTAENEARRAALVEAKQYNTGGAEPDLLSALSSKLGSDFIALVGFTTTDAGAPPTLDANLISDKFPIRTFINGTSIAPAVGGSSATFSYAEVHGDGVSLTVGDKVMFEGEILGMEELVTITATPSSGNATATFNRPHSIGCTIRAGRWPNKPYLTRYMLVVMSQAASLDPLKRAQVNRIMSRRVTGVTKWSIVAEDPGSPGQTLAYAVGGTIGNTTVGTRTF